MERLLANISIRKKLTIVIMLASLLMLTLVAGAFVAVEAYSSRDQLVAETRTLASSLGANIKQPLLVGDTAAANRLLSSLKLKNGIRAAYLFNAGGTPVASYLDQFDSQFLLRVIPEDFSARNRSFWTMATEVQVLNSWSHLSLFVPLFHDEQRIGTLYLLSDLKELYGRVSGILFGVLLSLPLLLGVSWYLAGKLQRPVSRPLMELVATMEQVSQTKDYRVRATKRTSDEVGILVDGFNRMLVQVEQHRQQLEKHQENLEQTVTQRTSELREMILALRQTKRQLEAAGQAKSQFIASITHELRTPLIGVLGMNELLFRTSLSDEQKLLADTVKRSGEDLLLLINNILDFSRIEAGRLRLEPVEFEIHRLLESVLDLLAGQAEEKGLQLISDIPLDVAWKVRGDEVRLKQILTNLIGNAIKFTAKGEVKVALDCRSAKAAVGRFEIQVSDTGVGMDESAQKQIFSAFYQADGTSTRDYGGSGLGLAIVSQLVELMDGEITLESTPGVGSLFQVALDLPMVEKVEFDLPEELLRQQVLICTVDCPQHALLASRLRELGLAVQIVPSVAEAWYQLRRAKQAEQSIDLLFCAPTAALPDGQALYQAVREDSVSRFLHRVLLPQSRLAVLSLERQESRLCSPFSWPEVCRVVQNSRQELRLVEKSTTPPERSAKEKAGAQSRQRLLVAGGGVASRELVKLALLESPFVVDAVPDLRGLLEGTAKDYAAVLLDLPFLPDAQLQTFLKRPERATKLLLFYDQDSQMQAYRSLVDVCLKKPFDRGQLQTALDSLFVAQKRSRSPGQEES